jgi:hypothetical protein
VCSFVDVSADLGVAVSFAIDVCVESRQSGGIVMRVVSA